MPPQAPETCPDAIGEEGMWECYSHYKLPSWWGGEGAKLVY